MKKYIAVKIVEAEPMSAMLAERTLNRKVDTANAKPTQTGETGHAGYLVQYEDGYKSWCPKKQFEEANRPCDAMTFSLAIEAAKKGMKIARKGWNGKGMYVWLCDENGPWTNSKGETFARQPYLYMKTAQDMVVPWVAAQSDVLGEDWEIVE